MAQIPTPGTPPSGSIPSFPPRRGPGPYITFDSISQAFQILQQDWGTWVGCSLVVLGATYAIQFPIQMGLQIMMLGSMQARTADFSALLPFYAVLFPIQIVITALQFVAVAGMINMAVRRQEGYTISVGDMFIGYKTKFVPLFIASLLQLLATYFGFILCFIPGLYASSVLSFTPMFVLRHEKSPVEAMQASYDTIKSQAWLFIAVLFVAGICSVLGFILCCIGIIATYPLWAITIGVNYYNFFQPPVQTVTSSQEGFVPYPRGPFQTAEFGGAQPPVETPSVPEPPLTPEYIVISEPPLPAEPMEPEAPEEPHAPEEG